MKIQAQINDEQSPLSKRENEVFGMLAEGLSQREMSDRLHRSFATISTHIEHIKDKLDADNSTQAVSIGVLKGFLSFKTFAVYGLIFSAINGLVTPSPAYANEEDGHPPIQRVIGRCRVNRFRGRGGRSRRKDDGLELWLDEE